MDAIKLRKLQKTLEHSEKLLTENAVKEVETDWDIILKCPECNCWKYENHKPNCSIGKTLSSIRECLEDVHGELSKMGLSK